MACLMTLKTNFSGFNTTPNRYERCIFQLNLKEEYKFLEYIGVLEKKELRILARTKVEQAP
jgi:hypothetical protein